MDKIKSAYRNSKNFYDDILTRKSFFAKLYNKIFWQGTDDNEIAEKILARVPNDFAGTLLDVPVGTGVFTAKKWSALARAKITCLDYSDDMLEQAKKRIGESAHINFLQGDVGNLPFENGAFDIVVCMNGMHAFPKKEIAFKEIFRVLKNGGKFIACFYVKGECSITDWLANKVLAKKGWFTPPFFTKEAVREILEKDYRTIDFEIDGSIVYFSAEKYVNSQIPPRTA